MKRIIISLFLISIFLFSGCGNETTEKEQEGTTESAQEETIEFTQEEMNKIGEAYSECNELMYLEIEETQEDFEECIKDKLGRKLYEKKKKYDAQSSS